MAVVTGHQILPTVRKIRKICQQSAVSRNFFYQIQSIIRHIESVYSVMDQIPVRIIGIRISRPGIGKRHETVPRIGVCEIGRHRITLRSLQGQYIAVPVVGQRPFHEPVGTFPGLILPRIRQTGEAVIGENIGVFLSTGMPPRPFGDIARMNESLKGPESRQVVPPNIRGIIVLACSLRNL